MSDDDDDDDEDLEEEEKKKKEQAADEKGKGGGEDGDEDDEDEDDTFVEAALTEVKVRARHKKFETEGDTEDVRPSVGDDSVPRPLVHPCRCSWRWWRRCWAGGGVEPNHG